MKIFVRLFILLVAISLPLLSLTRPAAAIDPAVTLTAPADNTSVSGTTTLRADTQGAIQSVAFSQRRVGSLTGTPNLTIPDALNLHPGIRPGEFWDSGSITTMGTIAEASLFLDLSHPDGDITMFLYAPDGTEVEIWPSLGPNTYDLSADLAGKLMVGTWELYIIDESPSDEGWPFGNGTLASWSLHLGSAWVGIGNGTRDPANVWTAPWSTASLTPGAYQVRARATHATGTVSAINDITVVGPYSLSGRITTGDGTGISGVKVYVTTTGYVAASTIINTGTTGSTGGYSVTGIPQGNVVITPSKSSYTFTPTNRTITVDGDTADIDFTAVIIPAVTLTAPADNTSVSGTTTLRAETQGAIQSVAFSQRSAGRLTRTPNLGIGTITDTGSIATWAIIAEASLSLKISHPYVRDLIVVLIAPDGTRLTIHDRTGSYDIDQTYWYLPLGGKQMAGRWQLEVTDVTSTDTNSGYLLSWSLHLGSAWINIGDGTQDPANVWTAPWSTASLTPGAYQVRARATCPTRSLDDINYVTVVGPYSVSGRIATGTGTGIGGVLLLLNGRMVKAAISNSNGDFTVASLPTGTYTLTPADSGYAFTPASRSVTITNASATNQNFTGKPLPKITGFTPTSGVVGTAVTLTGTNFTGATAVKFNTTSATFTVNSATQIVATVPVGATTGKLSVTTPNGIATSTHNFTVVPTYSIRGRITDSASIGMANVSVTRTGGVSVPTNADGYYVFTGVLAGSYTLTPVKAGYGFTPVNRSMTITNANVTGQSFVGRPVPTITGFTPASGPVGTHVVLTGTNFSGATVVKFNTDSASFTLNSATQITTTVPVGATPGKLSVTTPAGTATSAAGFTVTGSYSLSGRITNSAGVGLANVSVKSTGSTTAALTNATGYYTFTNLPAGNYTLTPERTGVTFTPASRTVAISTANVANQNFLASSTLSGRITNSAGVGVSGVPVKRIAGSTIAAAYTDANGNYKFSNVPPGSYTLTPERTGVSFTPASRLVTVSTTNVVNQNFIAGFSLSGRITNSAGVGVSGVPVKRSMGGSIAAAYTDTNGNYKFSNVPAGSYTLTPERTGVSFTPASRLVTISTANVVNQNFIASFTISGRITNSVSIGLANVLVKRVAGTSVAAAYTDANGYYKFVGVPSGSYTLTPVLPDVTFTPASRTVSVSTANVVNQNFIATFSISGRIATSAGAGLANVAVQCTAGSTIATVYSDANGNYKFNGVRSGSYTLTPVLAGVTFTPTSRSIVVGTLNLTNQNFIGSG